MMWKGFIVKEHEKLIAFLVLVLAVIGLVLLATTFDRGTVNDMALQGKLRIIDSSVTGLIAILGMAAQALFKISQAETDQAKTSKTLAEKIPPMTGEAAIAAETEAAAADVAEEGGAAWTR